MRLIGQSAERGHRVLKDLTLRGRRLTDLPGRDLGILLLDGADDVGRADAAHGHLLRIEPDPHAVIALSEEGDGADARQAATARRATESWRNCSGTRLSRLPSGENRLTIINTLGDFFFTVTPRRLTRSGRIGSASETRFCTMHLGQVQIGARLERDGQHVIAVIRALATRDTSCSRRR